MSALLAGSLGRFFYLPKLIITETFTAENAEIAEKAM
jgi:hypothetical protein